MKTYTTVYFKYVQFIIYQLYLNQSVKKKKCLFGFQYCQDSLYRLTFLQVTVIKSGQNVFFNVFKGTGEEPKAAETGWESTLE